MNQSVKKLKDHVARLQELLGEEEARVVQLRKNIQFMAGVFAERDTQNNITIEQLRQANAIQANQIAWFRGAHGPVAAGGEGQTH